MESTLKTRYPLWPPKPGDVVLVCGDDFVSKAIMWFQALWSWIRGRDGKSIWSHCCFFLDWLNVFETTYECAEGRDFARFYAGSYVMILRRKELTPEQHFQGVESVKDQNGLPYPKLRLFAHAIGLAKWIRTKAKECSWFTATYLKGSGFPLEANPIVYDSDMLPDELMKHVETGDMDIVFLGSMRLAGLVVGDGTNNQFVV